VRDGGVDSLFQKQAWGGAGEVRGDEPELEVYRATPPRPWLVCDAPTITIADADGHPAEVDGAM
jgi:hypothetical protein